MRVINIKNIDTVAHTWGGREYQPNESEDVCDVGVISLQKDSIFFGDIVTKAQVSNGEVIFTLKPDAWNWVNGNISQKVVVTEQPPYASASYRTHNDATEGITEILIEGVEPYIQSYIFYKMAESKFTGGGKLFCENAEFGDYTCASVYDKDGVIPLESRYLFPDWPVIHRYIEKQWVDISREGFGGVELDTKPLVAEVAQGLYLAVGYYAVNTGLTRRIIINYDFSKKLSGV